jgi:hypothetical protein
MALYQKKSFWKFVRHSPDLRFDTYKIHALTISRQVDIVFQTLKEGDTVPHVSFRCRVRDESIGGDNPFTFKDITSAELFKVYLYR